MKEENSEQLKILSKYLDQPLVLPQNIAAQIQMCNKAEVIKCYGRCDLDGTLTLKDDWAILTNIHLIYVENINGLIKLDKIERTKIQTVKLQEGNCFHQLLIFTKDLNVARMSFHFSTRQKKSIGYIQALLNGDATEELVNSTDPDLLYQFSFLSEIEKAQKTISLHKLGVFARLLAYLRPYQKDLIIGMMGAILMTLVSLGPAYLSGYLIDHIIRPFQDGKLDSKEAMAVAWIILGGLVCLYLAKEFFMWIRLKTMSVLGEKVARNLRHDLYQHLQKLGLDFYSSKQTGSIISRVSSDTDRIWDFIAFGIVEVTIALIMLLGLSCVLIALDFRLGILMTVPIPLLLIAIYLHGGKMQKMFLRVWRKWSSLTDVLSDTIPGIKVVKAFHQENYEKKRFNQRNDAFMQECNQIHLSWTGFWPLLMLSIHTIVILIWAMALPRLMGQTNLGPSLSAGTFVSFLLYMTMFSGPIEIIGQMARMLNRATSSAHRIFEILDTRPSLKLNNNGVVLKKIQGDVEFHNVGFAYDDMRQILKGVSFKIKAGEMVGLVGPSGSGKTTLINLLARFYDCQSGEILVDGVNIKDVDVGALRKQIGMVLQDPYLFHGTLIDNIRYGNPSADLRSVIQASIAANAHEFICKFSQGYETIIGERGHSLSGGERQRISIARAILMDPRILILDEATSSVDSETEGKIQQALDHLVAGRTVLAIAHRLSTLKKADRILVMKNGQLVEQGKPEQLLSLSGGIYKNLYQMQLNMNGSVYA